MGNQGKKQINAHSNVSIVDDDDDDDDDGIDSLWLILVDGCHMIISDERSQITTQYLTSYNYIGLNTHSQ